MQTAISSLAAAMMQLYPEQLPPDIQRRARAIAAAFQKERFATKRELNLLSQVTAEVSKIFPPDFASALPDAIETRVRVQECSSYVFCSPAHDVLFEYLRPEMFSKGINKLLPQFNKSKDDKLYI
jgi:hypothetical protein